MHTNAHTGRDRTSLSLKASRVESAHSTCRICFRFVTLRLPVRRLSGSIFFLSYIVDHVTPRTAHLLVACTCVAAAAAVCISCPTQSDPSCILHPSRRCGMPAPPAARSSRSSASAELMKRHLAQPRSPTTNERWNTSEGRNWRTSSLIAVCRV